MGDGSISRTLSAVRFAGRYRLVDFMLSNMVNSGIYTIGIVLNSHYQSLIGHIGMGKEWDLARKTGGVVFFPPYLADGRQGVNSEVDGPLQRAAEYIAMSRADIIVLADSSVAYNMDYQAAVEAHGKTGADVTAIYTRMSVAPGERGSATVFDLTEDGRVLAVSAAQPLEDKQNWSLGAYIMRKNHFIRLIAGEKNCGMLRFSRVLIADALERLNIRAYEFRGYSAQINSVDTFYRYNMEMLDIEKRNALFDYEGRRIHTSRRDSLPTKYGKKAEIKNSIIAEGCQIDGEVTDSVIFRNVRIREGAVVKNCILQEGAVVEKNTKLDYIIADRGVFISENRTMTGYSTYPVYIENSRII
jgi:glucose-1-phosphate adenylyltransferase